jgi:hypothetical protein
MKKLIICVLFAFCATISFGQQQTFVWSTVSGSGARVIPMSSVKAEVMRLYDRYSWMRFERDLNEEIFIDRRERRDVIVGLYNWSLDDPRADRIEQQHRRQIITWYDNYRNFVYMRDIGSMLIVSFVMGDRVMEVTFGNQQFRGWYPTRGNRDFFVERVDWLLR